MVEAVVVLPVFIVIFAGTLYVRDRVLARQEAKTLARSCAWRYSMNGCASVPEGCDGIVGKSSSSSRDSEVDQQVRQRIDEAIGGDTQGVVATIVDPLLGPAIDAALGDSATATTSRDLERPGVLGGDIATVEGHYDLACNLAHTTPAKVVEDAWNLFPLKP